MQKKNTSENFQIGLTPKINKGCYLIQVADKDHHISKKLLIQ